MSAQQAPASARHEGVTVAGDPQSGHLVARKTARPGAEHDLRREVAVLRLLDGLAVCVPVDPHHDGSGGQIDLVYVGPRTLVDLEVLPPGELLTALAGIARTLRAAHDRGVSHGRLTADHVLLDEHGEPVLTGWSEAGLREDAHASVRVPGTTPDDDRDENRPGTDGDECIVHREESTTGRVAGSPRAFDPAADIASLGDLAARAAQTNRLLGGRARTQLAAVAAAARHPDASVRPPLSELVRVLELAGSSLNGPVDSSRRRRRSGRSSSARRAVDSAIGRLSLAAVGATAAAALTVIALDHRGPEPSASPSAAARSATSDGTGDGAAIDGSDNALGPDGDADAVRASAAADRSGGVPPTSAAGPPQPTGGVGPDGPATTSTGGAATDPQQPTLPAGSCPTDAGRLARDGLPARCAPSVALDGAQIRVGAVRYALGAPGDQVGLSDPTCRGLLTPILWERSSGRLYRFDGWASATAPLTGRLAGVVPGSTGLLDPLGEVCGPVLITMPNGTVTQLDDPAGG